MWVSSRNSSALPGPPGGFGLGRLHLRRADPVAPQLLAGLSRHHHHQVLDDGQMMEFMRDLEGSNQSLVKPPIGRKGRYVLAPIHDPAVTGAQGAGDHVEYRGLAGAVRPDQAGDGTLGDGKRTAVDSPEGTEIDRQVFAGKNRQRIGHSAGPPFAERIAATGCQRQPSAAAARAYPRPKGLLRRLPPDHRCIVPPGVCRLILRSRLLPVYLTPMAISTTIAGGSRADGASRRDGSDFSRCQETAPGGVVAGRIGGRGR